MNAPLPTEVAHAVEAALAERGPAARLASVRPIAGGSVNRAARLETDAGDCFFLKWNARAPAGTFAAEADGLAALARAVGEAARVPEVVAVGASWLLLEYVAPGLPGPGAAERLGAALARLHRWGATLPGPARWGWPRDNFIGALPQANGPLPSWAAFWRDRRLAPQLARARAQGHGTGPAGRALDRVLDRVPALLADVEAEGPSLLHGDLWSGNVYADARGIPVFVDPATYLGHREVDLAMTELFGGIPGPWPAAYARAWPLDPAYHAYRRDLYQLYYLLVHVNLFGPSYEAGCAEAARRVLAATE